MVPEEVTFLVPVAAYAEVVAVNGIVITNKVIMI